MTLPDVLESVKDFQEHRSVLLVSVCNRPILSPIVIEAVIFTLLDVLVLIHSLETVGCRLVVHDINGIGREM